MSKAYKKYDDHIKEMVIKSGNPNLFPDLDIPRSTALYWIKLSKRKIKIHNIDIDSALETRVKDLESKLEQERAKNLFLTEVLEQLKGFKEIYNRKSNRVIIVDAILKYNQWIGISVLCGLLGIPNNKFYRFKVETKGCERVGLKKCKILSPNQLTFREQEIIYNLANDPRLTYLSVRGLQLYAFREGILTCGYDSWRKYTREFRGIVKRVNHNKKYKKGIRASKVNEIWHIDITEFKLKDGKKAYLQAVMDNYSRKIVNWKFSLNKKIDISIENIQEATIQSSPQYLLSDGGGENIGKDLKKVILGKGITSLIAKKDVISSNSMIEYFFKVLKNRFINKYKSYKPAKLYRLISRSVKLFRI